MWKGGRDAVKMIGREGRMEECRREGDWNEEEEEGEREERR